MLAIFEICLVSLSCLFTSLTKVLKCATFLLKFGGGLLGFLCGFIFNDFIHTCAKYVNI